MSDSTTSSNRTESKIVNEDETNNGSNTDAKDSKPKISMSMKKPLSGFSAKKSTGPPIQIKFNTQKIVANSQPPTLKRPSGSLAAVFGDFSDEEPEEMPPEAKMRMKNRGRNTPTSAGPNSFGKTKHGFIDTKKVFEKNLREAALMLCEEEKEEKKKRRF